MKKALVLLLSIFTAASLFGQIDLGVRFGANYTYRGFEENAFAEYAGDITDPASINGYTGGVFAGMHSDGFGIQFEILAPVEGFSISRLLEGEPFSDIISGTRLSTEYVNAVLMARYGFDLSIAEPYLGVGFSFGIPVAEMLSGDAYILIENFDLTRLGLAFSVGVILLDIVDVDLRYNTGITDIYSGDISYTHPMFGQLIRLSLGFHIF
ncbi:MAG: outer membrane beta-barrel protein [Candidatus Marinimicrobia bacterium]|nr:outer membrane beta-barrel protein [Candidatus Neomarinimicrobiota bacterium]